MLNFDDFKKIIRKQQLSIYPDELENVGFYFSPDDSSGVELVRVGVAFFDSSCECLLASYHLNDIVTYDKAWEIYTKSLKQC